MNETQGQENSPEVTAIEAETTESLTAPETLIASEIIEPNKTFQDLEDEEKHVSSCVCDICLTDNLLKTVGIVRCIRCLNPFCIHFASKADPLNYCVSCMSDLSLVREVVTKSYEHYNESTDTFTKYSRRARQVRMEGQDWLFAQRKISTLSDAELDINIEYHRQACSLMLIESDKRRAEKMHRNAGIKISVSSTPSVIKSANGSSSTVTTTVSRKTSTTKTDKKAAQAQALIESLLGKMSFEDLQKVLGGK